MIHRSRTLPSRATRFAILLAATGATGVLTGTVQAQTAASGVGPRYMTWAGRPTTTTPASVIAAEAETKAQFQPEPEPAPAPTRRAMIPRQVAPTQAISRPTLQPTPVPQRVSRGPTPASAWLDPQPVPAFAPGAPDPLAYTRETPAMAVAADTTTQPVWSAAPVSQPSQAQPEYLADTTPPPVSAVPQPTASAAVADPMAPRADALIFRLRPQAALQPSAASSDQAGPQVYAEAAAPSPALVAARPGQQTSRYYSVHREAGHAPDRTPLPEAVFYDSVALDLAEPPETQPPLRDTQGRLRPPVRDEDPERP